MDKSMLFSFFLTYAVVSLRQTDAITNVYRSK